MMDSKTRVFVLTLFSLSLWLWASAARAEFFRAPASTALGGTGVAGISGTEGALINPALVPLHRGSGLDGYYRDGALSDGAHRTDYGVGAIDNSPGVWFPGALHYLRLRDTGSAARPADGELWHVAIGEVKERFAFGVSGYRLVYNLDPDQSYTQWNYSLGGVYMISGDLGVAYVLKNLAGVGSDVPEGLREDLQQTAGVLVGIANVARLRVDLSRRERRNPDHKMVYMVGLESKTSDLLLLRLGYRYDDLADQRVWSAGLAFDGPRLRLDYSVEKSQNSASGALHSVDLRLPF
jgi:hypothetical protein